jgi:hypothetical protein
MEDKIMYGTKIKQTSYDSTCGHEATKDIVKEDRREIPMQLDFLWENVGMYEKCVNLLEEKLNVVMGPTCQSLEPDKNKESLVCELSANINKISNEIGRLNERLRTMLNSIQL